MTHLEAFLYGWIAGIAAVVVCLLYGFDVLLRFYTLVNPYVRRHKSGGRRKNQGNIASITREEALHLLHARQKDKKSLQELGLEGMTGSTALYTPIKLVSTCTLAWYDAATRSCGTPVECRLSLVGSVLSVSELMPTRRGLMVVEETEGNTLQRNGAVFAEHLKGKVDVARLQTPQLIKKFDKHHCRKACMPPSFLGRRLLQMTTTDGRPFFAGKTAGDIFGSSSIDNSVDSLVDLPSMDGADDEDGGGSGTRSMGAWTTLVVRFHSARDEERWLTLLTGLEEAEAWREFAKNVPNPDTFNLFASRFLFQNFSGIGFTHLLRGAIQNKLKKVSLVKFPRDLEGLIVLDDFLMGNALPWISEVSEPTVSTNGELGFDFNIQYTGGEEGFVLYFRLALSYRGIRIPHVIISARLLELHGTAHISIGPPPSTKFWIAGHKPPVLRAEWRQGCASGRGLLHRILTSLPDLSGMLTNLIKLYLFSDMILPNMDDFPLPSVESAPSTETKVRERTFDRHRAAMMSGAQPASPSSASASPRGKGSARESDGPAGAAGRDSEAADRQSDEQSCGFSSQQDGEGPPNATAASSSSRRSKRKDDRTRRTELRELGANMSRAAVSHTKQKN